MVIALANLLQNTEEEELIAIASATRSHLGAIAIDVFVTLLAEPKYRKIGNLFLSLYSLSPNLTSLTKLGRRS